MPTPTTRTPTLTTPTRTRTRTTPASDAALRRATEPVEPTRFLSEHWERRPLHVARGKPGRFDDLFSAHDAERLVSEPGLRTPGLRLVKAGVRIDPRSYTTDVSWRPQPFTGMSDAGRVLAEFEAGATIVLQGLHVTRLAPARYCRGLEARLGHPTQANAYWTPRRSQGLPVHHDTHDVFVLQISGAKRWLVYEPVLELPLRDQRYSPSLGGPGETVLDVTLAPGDTLYLPRGWLHEALTSEQDSLHLTIGVNVRAWVDALRLLLARCGDDVELRRAVPASGEGAAEAFERVGARLGSDWVAKALRERFVATRRPILDGQLQALRALDALGADDLVERRDTVIADFDGERLSFEGKALVIPAHACEEVEALVEADGPVRISDLPGRLDDPGRLVLVGRLVREGFLRPM